MAGLRRRGLAHPRTSLGELIGLSTPPEPQKELPSIFELLDLSSPEPVTLETLNTRLAASERRTTKKIEDGLAELKLAVHQSSANSMEFTAKIASSQTDKWTKVLEEATNPKKRRQREVHAGLERINGDQDLGWWIRQISKIAVAIKVLLL